MFENAQLSQVKKHNGFNNMTTAVSSLTSSAGWWFRSGFLMIGFSRFPPCVQKSSVLFQRGMKSQVIKPNWLPLFERQAWISCHWGASNAVSQVWTIWTPGKCAVCKKQCSYRPSTIDQQVKLSSGPAAEAPTDCRQLTCNSELLTGKQSLQ